MFGCKIERKTEGRVGMKIRINVSFCKKVKFSLREKKKV